MIVIFTSHYPFAGEPFVEDEINWLAKQREDICVVPLCYHKDRILENIPRNIKVIILRKHRYDIAALIAAMLRIPAKETREEFKFAAQILGYSRQKRTVLKKILIAYYISMIMSKTLRQLTVPEDAVFYSYWMDEAAYGLTEYKRLHPNALCICRAHGSDCFIEKFYQPFRREISAGLDAVFPVSEAGKKSIEALLLPHISGKAAPVKVQRLGVVKASDKMNPLSGGEELCIVSCSAVIALKRLDLLIDALAAVQEVRIHWTHFGDGGEMDAIQKQAKEKLKNGNVTYTFRGQLPKKDILKWYENHHVDVFVNCSDSEGIPVSVMEAFAYGIPAIGRNVGGVSEIVRNGYNGILLPEKCTSEQLKGAVLKMAENSRDETEQLRNGAYSSYCNDYCAEKNYRQFYDELFKSTEIRNIDEVYEHR